MNCCYDNGECKQGHGCPVREMPVTMEETPPSIYERIADLFVWLMFTIGMFVSLGCVAFVAGRFL